MQTKLLPKSLDLYAPDGSEIRLLVETERGSSVHCELPAGGVSKAVRHRGVEEIWFFLSGNGEVWRKAGDVEEIVEARPGLALTIPAGVHFQFRNTGEGPLRFVLTTMPPWPGEDEAVAVEGPWSAK